MTPRCDLFWNLAYGLPFPDRSVDRIYSSHLLEHLTFIQGQNLLVECRRVLKPGGELSVCVPDARMYVDAYLGELTLDRSDFGVAGAYFETTAIDALNYIAYMDDHHKYMFDQENLNFRLQIAGFDSVESRDFDPSLDLSSRKSQSIYARGFRPQELS